MGSGSLIFAGRDWLWPAVGVVVATLLLLLWSYSKSALPPRLRAACFFLKLTGLLLLAFCVLEPLWSGQRAKSGANQLVILADNSRGMSIKDGGALKTRGEEMRDLISDPQKAKWLGVVEEDFKVRRYQFDRRLEYSRDFAELRFDGPATSLASALRGVAERHRNQPLAGIVLFTDGNATDIAEGLPDLSGLPPVYPVVIGKDDDLRDLSIGRLNVSQTSFEDAPVIVQAEVSAVGFPGERIVAELREVGHSTPSMRATLGKVPVKPSAPEILSQVQSAGNGSEPVGFRFQVRPRTGQITFYQLKVRAQGDDASGAAGREATMENNVRTVVVDRGQGPLRVLYVSGRPNWEFKFMNRAVQEDPQIELVAMIRLARREPKFDFKGRAGETSNPLFRGFDKKGEEAERYDQPVLVRLNTRDDVELRDGFPKSAESLYDYHALILDDLEAAFFTPDQMQLVQKFVSERGGGFLMLGGAETFREGNYDRTAIGSMLPVYLDRMSEADAPSNWRLNLTREGWLQPWVRVQENESSEHKRLEQMPEFHVMNRVRAIKPGASALATITDTQGNAFPALVAQRFGRGRSAALTIGDFWQWGLSDETNRVVFDKAWRQMVRWLVSDVPGRVEMSVQRIADDPQSAVRIQVRAKDRSFLPLDNATVALEVKLATAIAGTNSATGGSNAVVRLIAEAASSEPGTYEATFVPRVEGGYLVEAKVTDGQGVEAGKAAAAWSDDLAAEEFRSLKPNRALLETIASRTGGEVLKASQLDSFAASLPRRSAPVQEVWTYPVWHSPWLFFAAMLCLVAEWGVRRWRGLA
ncbi:MAG TPA: glutamine amidotransferase [Roseimicrobium sp.]|nr:glutamine amidotransferase [Roseimicrobium sp.]